MSDLLTLFAPDAERASVLAACMEPHGVGDASAEWPNNLLSRRTVIASTGRIARRGDVVRQAVDPAELAHCRAVATEIAGRMVGVEVGMGSNAGSEFYPFWVAADVEGARPPRIDEALITRVFAGTIFPLATMTVEPLVERGVWWSEVEADGEESEASYFEPWRAMIAWFAARTDFVDTAFVRIGDRRALWDAEAHPEHYPPGTELTGCVLPRLALGLTPTGSLVGLFGHVVQT